MLTKCIWTSHTIGFFQKIFGKNLKIYLKYEKNSNFYRFHSIVLPLSVSKQFSLSMYPPQKKKIARAEVFFFPIGWCEFRPA